MFGHSKEILMDRYVIHNLNCAYEITKVTINFPVLRSSVL